MYVEDPAGSQGQARQGQARQGQDRQEQARQGQSRQGQARQGQGSMERALGGREKEAEIWEEHC